MTSILPGSEQDIDKLNELMIAFNLQQLPFPENPPWKTLSYVYKKEEQLLGGIYGYLIMNNILKVDVLYVLEEYRGSEYGTKLLQKLELEAKQQNAYLSMLDTYDFQALVRHQHSIFG